MLVTVVDGRTRRGERNREAIIDALIACYGAGSLQPSVQEVADRAGVSARSVHNHFVDVEALRAEVARRQWERCTRLVEPVDPALPLAERVERIATQRAAIFESITPVRRAALASLPDSPTIAANLARADRALRRQLDRVFAVEPDVLDAIDAAASWDTWNRLRTSQGCGVARARRVLVTMISKLVEGRT